MFKWLENLLNKEEPYQPCWVELPEGKKVDINDKELPFVEYTSNWKNIYQFLSKSKIMQINVREWKSPMQELFQLWRRDYDNIKVSTEYFPEQVITLFTVEHQELGIGFSIECYALGATYTVELIETNTGLTLAEIIELIWVCGHFQLTKEYQRYLRIQRIKQQREDALMREKVAMANAVVRENQTTRIRKYLEENK